VVALEFAQPGIRANPMAPGEIETDLVNRLVGKENPHPGRELRQLEQKRSVIKILAAIATNNMVTHRFPRSSISRPDSGVTRDRHGL